MPIHVSQVSRVHYPPRPASQAPCIDHMVYKNRTRVLLPCLFINNRGLLLLEPCPPFNKVQPQFTYVAQMEVRSHHYCSPKYHPIEKFWTNLESWASFTLTWMNSLGSSISAFGRLYPRAASSPCPKKFKVNYLLMNRILEFGIAIWFYQMSVLDNVTFNE